MKQKTAIQRTARAALLLVALLLTNINAWADTVSYIDEDGETQTVTAAVIDENYNLSGGIGEGWYVVTGTVTYTGTVTLTGNVTIILADGCQMNIGSSNSRINGYGILGYIIKKSNYYNLTIYGQSAGTGSLNVYTTGKSHYCISGKDIIINGGNITADADGNNSEAIRAKDSGSVTINGGTVNAATAILSESRNININGGIVNASGGIIAVNEVVIKGGIVNANGDTYGISAGYGIDLSWTRPTDRIYASSYQAGKGTVTIASGKPFIDEDGNLHTASALGTINGKTLNPT